MEGESEHNNSLTGKCNWQLFCIVLKVLALQTKIATFIYNTEMCEHFHDIHKSKPTRLDTQV